MPALVGERGGVSVLYAWTVGDSIHMVYHFTLHTSITHELAC